MLRTPTSLIKTRIQHEVMSVIHERPEGTLRQRVVREMVSLILSKRFSRETCSNAMDRGRLDQ